ncbi:MAG: tyrosine-protein phosphatase [Phycisphaerales bacterium]|nr:tyrosine-protein phosphatase [Phycisphaerales bacterium]
MVIVHLQGRRGVRRPWVLVLLFIVSAVAAGAWTWDAFVKDRIIPRNFGVVEAGQIYRSGRLTPETMEKVVRQNGIRTVVDLGAWKEGSPEDEAARAAAERNGAVRVRLPRLEGDGTGDPNSYVLALRMMADPSKRPVLVQCAAGAQRTGACVILYRHVVEGRPIAEVYPESFEHRHDPGDNWKMLAYLADWAEPIARAFRGGGTVEGWPPVKGRGAGGGVEGDQRPSGPSTPE